MERMNEATHRIEYALLFPAGNIEPLPNRQAAEDLLASLTEANRGGYRLVARTVSLWYLLSSETVY